MSHWYALSPESTHDSAYAEYEALPEEIRALYSYEQYQWLSGDEKARLIATETEPDYLD